jgi:hydrogenase 3 maturation protease
VEEIGGIILSTHTLPLSVMAEIIKQTVGAKVMVLGIQPETIEFGEGLSEKLQEASAEIARTIAAALRKTGGGRRSDDGSC